MKKVGASHFLYTIIRNHFVDFLESVVLPGAEETI